MYHTLPFVDLNPLDAMNDEMREFQDRRACTMALNRLRGIHNKKQNVPAIVSLFNKVVGKKGQTVKRGPANRMKKVAEKFQGPQASVHPKSAHPLTGRGKLTPKNIDLNNSKLRSMDATPMLNEAVHSDQSDHETDDDDDMSLDDDYFTDLPPDYSMNESRANVKSVSFV